MNKTDALKEVSQIEKRLAELRKIIENNKKTLDDIGSYEQACLILEDMNYSDKISDYEKLLMIIKATNFIDNDYEIWIPTFNSNSNNYIPYLEKKKGAWSLYAVGYCYSSALCPVGLYYMKESSARLMINRFIFLYNKVWG